MLLSANAVQSTEYDIVVAEPPTKISQLVGEYDRERKQHTANLTLSRYKLAGTDLGVPFTHKGRTYLLFGDTVGIKGGDAIAYTEDDNPEDGLDLVFLQDEEGAYKPVKIPGISQFGFEVPMEGTSVGGRMYIYHTTDRSVDRYMGRSVVAVSEDDGHTFKHLYDLSSRHFINVSAVQVDLRDWTGFPESEGVGLAIFGAGQFRKGEIRLAFQPTEKIESPEAIRFFAGAAGDGKPTWSPFEKDARPLVDEACVGEISVSFNRFIKKWIMLYTCNAASLLTMMRTADFPWGPWSEGQVIFEPSKNGAFCRYVHSSWEKEKCDAIHEPGWQNVVGNCYGPYQFEDMAIGDDTSTTVYFTLSTWNPYTVILMKMKLQKVARQSGKG
jgi:hypothetical protein